MTTGIDTRSLLADALDETAAWRRGKAAEYPEDERNARSARALDALAEHVRAVVPEGDQRVGVITLETRLAGLDILSLGENATRAVGRVGFHNGPDASVDRYLDEIADAVREDMRLKEESDRDHLQDLIDDADADLRTEYDQPEGSYVREATDEYEGAGFDVESVPSGAIAMRAHELQREAE